MKVLIDKATHVDIGTKRVCVTRLEVTAISNWLEFNFVVRGIGLIDIHVVSYELEEFVKSGGDMLAFARKKVYDRFVEKVNGT